MATTEAAAILQQRDPQLGVLIAQLGEDPWPDRNPPDSLLAALARAVLAQQIAPKAAEIIYQRFLGLFPQASPSAEALPEATLRGAGISRPKVTYLKALARAELPSWAALETMEDEAIVRSLTAVIPILVACALDFDLRTFLNMGIVPLGKRASAAQIGMSGSVISFLNAEIGGG